MKISKVSEVFSGKPQNACNKCYDDKKCKGVYMSMPVFLDNGKDKPMTYLCHKAICPLCGDIKFYDNGRNLTAGIYRLAGNQPDFNLQFWKELKGVDIQAFIRLMLAEPRRQYYNWDELPKAQGVGHRAEFYEPKH